MPLIRFPTVKGLVYTIDLSKIADRENPRTVEAPIRSSFNGTMFIDWGDGNTEEITSSQGSWYAHTYAEGAGEVFRIVMRKADGSFPFLGFNNTYQDVEPVYNITLAVTSVDHFAGIVFNGTLTNVVPYMNRCSNLQYLDTRLTGQHNYRALFQICQKCFSLEQEIGSFCFDFCVADDNSTFNLAFAGAKIKGVIPNGMFANNINAKNFNGIFNGCSGLEGSIPPELFDNNMLCISFQNAFRGCSGLTGAPYIFWKEDGSIDTDKFPQLSTGANCYTGCSDALRAQVPTDYGGTMTV